MEPTNSTPDRTTWKHWIGTTAALAFLVLGVPFIAALPIALALVIALPLATVLIDLTRALTIAQRQR